MKYQIIYADPAWKYNDTGCNGSAQKHYNCMTLEDICALPVKNISDENCVLFLWVTGPFLFDARRVIRAWGFKYKTIGFVWVKRNRKSIWTWFWGGGHWTRANAEFCLIAVKGKIKRVDAAVHQIVETPIFKKHSKKPNEVRKRIVKLMGDLPRIELFARKKFPGWDVWGNEVDSDIKLENLE
jgi:N6-adenosine-specific RNA methylase IME4